MHDGKCNELLVREETIHGRGPAEAVYIPNLLPSLRFLRLVIFFFFCIIIGCCESSCSPASLPSLPPSLPRFTVLTLTDRQLMGKLAACMRRSNSARKLMCCIKGGYVAVLGEEEGGPGSETVWDRPGLGKHSGLGLTSLSECGLIKSLPVFIYLSMYLFNQLFMYLFIQFPGLCLLFGCRSQNWQLSTPRNKNMESQRIHF